VLGYVSHNRLYIEPVIGSVPLKRLNAEHIEQVLAAVPSSASTRRRVFSTLRAALNGAVRRRLIQWNPCSGIEPWPENGTQADTWTPEQEQQFIAATADHKLGLLYRVALLTGARRGELCGLRWDGADLDAGVLVIEHTLLELNGKLTEGKPKTRAGERRLYVGPDTASLLRRHREAQELEFQFNGLPAPELVFCREDGQPFRPGYISKKFRELSTAAGLPGIKLHATRHSAISTMAAVGIDRDVRKKAVGHSADNVHDRYTHYQDSQLREAAADVERFVTGRGEQA
jgi:integrase